MAPSPLSTRKPKSISSPLLFSSTPAKLDVQVSVSFARTGSPNEISIPPWTIRAIFGPRPTSISSDPVPGMMLAATNNGGAVRSAPARCRGFLSAIPVT